MFPRFLNLDQIFGLLSRAVRFVDCLADPADIVSKLGCRLCCQFSTQEKGSCPWVKVPYKFTRLFLGSWNFFAAKSICDSGLAMLILWLKSSTRATSGNRGRVLNSRHFKWWYDVLLMWRLLDWIQAGLSLFWSGWSNFQLSCREDYVTTALVHMDFSLCAGEASYYIVCCCMCFTCAWKC